MSKPTMIYTHVLKQGEPAGVRARSISCNKQTDWFGSRINC